MNSQDITLTEGRARQAVNDTVTHVIMPKVNNTVKKAVEDERPKTGIVTKFYQYLDKAEVLLDGTNEKVLCTLLHRFGGELIDFYTPNGDDIYCEKLNEPCIKPRGALHCAVMNINNNSNEWLLLGYFQPDDIVGCNPAKMGNFKIVTRGGTNQFWIKFGYDGLDIRSITPTSMNVGEMADDMTSIDYASSDDVYTKEDVYNKTEVYTKEEVDELIAEKIAEALAEQGDDD